jgi:ornithine lipid hydroxylase
MTVRRAASWLVYPAVMAAAMIAMVAGMERGVDLTLMVVAVSMGATAVVIVLERLMPHIPEWNRSHGDFVSDGLHMIVALIAVPELFRAFAYGGLYQVSAWLSGTIRVGMWPGSWPIAVQLVLALLLTELVQYWVHRTMHRSEPLWRVHSMHHGAERLYWLNAGRIHPFEAVITHVELVLLLIFLGAPLEVLALHLAFLSVHTTVQHSNIEMRLGALNWIFSQAELHRWHHSPDWQESNTNYGATLIIWDIVFGTRYLPHDRASSARPGIGDIPEYPRGYLAQVIAPFRWKTSRTSRDRAPVDP